jgi:DNA-binding CsgD family transcriptional regulator
MQPAQLNRPRQFAAAIDALPLTIVFNLPLQKGDQPWPNFPAEAVGIDDSVATRLHRRPFGLTRREREVWTLLAFRLTDQEIADRLSISRRTVESHVSHILAKLDVCNRYQAGAAARSLGHAWQRLEDH